MVKSPRSQSKITVAAIDSLAPGKGSVAQRIRLYSGLILMTFVISHYINHAFGNISLELMNDAQIWRQWFWLSWPGTIALYGALIIHIVMVLWKLVLRKSLRLPMWEWVQVLLGLFIPYLLLTHILAMRGTIQGLGIHVDYTLAFGMMWPSAALAQNSLLIITWIHGCLGIHFWLRLRAWYRDYFVWLAALATLLPALALTGWVNAAKTNAIELLKLKLENPEAAANYFGTIDYIYDDLLPKVELGQTIVIYLALALIILFAIHQVILRFKKRVRIDYGDGKLVTSSPGSTILEISRQAGIPHMSVCGGRARCSTCRTMIIEGEENIEPMTDAEATLLKRFKSDQPIRLACQAVVKGDVKLRPLMQPNKQLVSQNNADSLGWGVERKIAILFLDIRGFSRISEKALPYDVVYILNSFFGEVAKAVESNNGYVDKFMGDGMMALFGLSSTKEIASRDAIKAAIDCEKATQRVSRLLEQHLSEPIKIGIGIHTGDAVIGRIGKTSDQSEPSRLTAIGDSVNVSARLEQATKELVTPLVISSHTAKLAGLENLNQYGDETEITVRNISRPVKIVAIRQIDLLEKSLE